MQLFLINLARSKDRLALMKGQLGDRFERIEAVEGAAVPERFAHQFSSPGSLNAFEIGCYASHLLAAEQIVVRGLPSAIILEDDVELAPDFFVASDRAVSACSVGWDFVSLCDSKLSPHCRVAEIETRHLVKFVWPPKATAAYILSYSGALKLLCPRRRCRPVDVDIHYSCDVAFNGFGVLPPPALRISPISSTIGGRKHRFHWRTAPLKYLLGRLGELRKFGFRGLIEATFQSHPD